MSCANNSATCPATASRTAAGLRPRAGHDTVTYATKLAIQTLGRRVLALEADSARLDRLLDELVHRSAPGLCAVYGVGTRSAAYSARRGG